MKAAISNIIAIVLTFVFTCLLAFVLFVYPLLHCAEAQRLRQDVQEAQLTIRYSEVQ